MKFAKMSVLALSLGLFLASCGGGNGETKPADTVAAPAPVATPAAEPAPAAADTTHHADTAKAAATTAAPAAEPKKDEKKK